MSEQVIWWALEGIAKGGIKVAAKMTPKRELDIFPHRMHVKGRPWWYFDAYMGGLVDCR